MRYSPTAVYTGAALALGLGAVAGVSLCYRPSLRVGHLRLHEARAVNNPRIEIPALETIIATPTVTATSTMSEPMSEPAVERKKIMRPDYFPQNCNWNDLEYTWQSIKDAKQGRLSDDDVSALICFLEPNEKTELVGDLVEYCRSSDFSAENVSPLVVVKRALFAELSNELIAKDENRYYPSEFSDLLALAAGEMISRGLRVHLQRNDPDQLYYLCRAAWEFSGMQYGVNSEGDEIARYLDQSEFRTITGVLREADENYEKRIVERINQPDQNPEEMQELRHDLEIHKERVRMFEESVQVILDSLR